LDTDGEPLTEVTRQLVSEINRAHGMAFTPTSLTRTLARLHQLAEDLTTP